MTIIKTQFFQKNSWKKLAVIKTGFLIYSLTWLVFSFCLHCLSTMSDLFCPQCQTAYEPSDRFCELCGQPFYSGILTDESSASVELSSPSTSSYTLILQNGKQFQLDQTQWVGRSDPANGWLPAIDLSAQGGLDGGVSRKHARITIEAGQLFVEDVGSSNGTTLNGVHLTIGQRFPIQHGDKLLFGRVYARVVVND